MIAHALARKAVRGRVAASHALQVAQASWAQCDDRRASGSPSRTNQGGAVRKPVRLPGTKKQRELSAVDVEEGIAQSGQ